MFDKRLQTVRSTMGGWGGEKKQLTLPDMKTYYKAIVIKCDNDKRDRKINETEEGCSKTNTAVYKKMICNKGGTINKEGRMNYLVKCYKN